MKSRVVVDTNVAIAANGRDTHADSACQQACVKELAAACREMIIVIDNKDLIFKEYLDNLRPKDKKSKVKKDDPGFLFFRHVENYQWGGERVRRVPITPSSNASRSFEELPPNTLDRSDRKFLATAKVGKADILNATDSDWNQQKALTESLGVTVRQLCPQHASKQSR